MSNYFRVTAYHETENISVIIDSNGYYGEIWELSAFMIQKGFKVLEVSDSSQFLDGNIERSEVVTDSLILRACCTGKPTYNGKSVEVEGKFYTPEK
jgi:hypothetical protein